MAKKQTFENKLTKGDAGKKNIIKLIKSHISKKTGSIRFSEEILSVPDGKTPENYIKEFINK